MDCAEFLADRGEVHVQLLYTLGETFTPLAGGAASNNHDPRGVHSGIPLTMVFYGINLAPLEGQLRAVDSEMLSPFYADDAVFDGSQRKSAQLLKMLMNRGPDHKFS